MTNKQDFIKLFKGLRVAYPNFKILETDEEKSFWFQMLKHIDYNTLSNAMLKYISTHNYPPSIADLRGLCAEEKMQGYMRFEEAWLHCCQLVTKYGVYLPEKALAEMDNLTCSVMKSVGWRRFCNSDVNDNFIKKEFRDFYNAKLNEIKNKLLLPQKDNETDNKLQDKNNAPYVEFYKERGNLDT